MNARPRVPTETNIGWREFASEAGRQERGADPGAIPDDWLWLCEADYSTGKIQACGAGARVRRLAARGERFCREANQPIPGGIAARACPFREVAARSECRGRA